MDNQELNKALDTQYAITAINTEDGSSRIRKRKKYKSAVKIAKQLSGSDRKVTIREVGEDADCINDYGLFESGAYHAGSDGLVFLPLQCISKFNELVK